MKNILSEKAIEWNEGLTYKNMYGKTSDEEGKVNVFIDRDSTNEPLFVGSYDLRPFKLNDEIIKSFGDYIGGVISFGCNYSRHYVRREANNIYVY